MLTGIGDAGVLAAVRIAGTDMGIDQVDTLLRTAEIDTGAGFEVLVEVDAHSRTELGARVIGAYRLGNSDAAPATHTSGESSTPPALSALEH